MNDYIARHHCRCYNATTNHPCKNTRHCLQITITKEVRLITWLVQN